MPPGLTRASVASTRRAGDRPLTASCRSRFDTEVTDIVVDAALARELVDERFPEWATLPLRPVEPGGFDHRSFRLGDRLLVRLPSAPAYAPQVRKEQRWLPVLAPELPLPIPRIAGIGEPGPRFPFPWSVYDWIEGETAADARIDDEVALARDLAGFLVELRGVDTADAPGPGTHSAYRGGPLERWHDEIEAMLPRIGDGRERARAAAIWGDALAEPFRDLSMWFHGDVARANLLVRDGALAAVIDFGCSGVGDPACDTVIVWTHFAGTARREFVRAYDVDDATWARGRGWALWKALILLDSPERRWVELAHRTMEALLNE
jgi:aminoglycoside phosphotransferase (APT) family kinase protein